MTENTFYHWKDNELILQVYVQPRASKDEIVGQYADSLKIRITAPPVDGKANKYLVKFLAKTFAVPTANIQLLSGQSGRTKRFSIKNPQQFPAGISLESET